jgi:hypothetical protein
MTGRSKGQKRDRSPSGGLRQSRGRLEPRSTSTQSARRTPSPSSPRQSRHSPPPALGRMERPRPNRSTSFPNRSYTKKLKESVKTTRNLNDRSRSTTRESVKTIFTKLPSSKELVQTTPVDHSYELPPHPEVSPEPRLLPNYYKTLEEWIDWFKTPDGDDDLLIDPHNLEGPMSKIWGRTTLDIGFFTMFNFGGEALALSSPSGQVLVFTRKESDPSYLIPDDLQAIMEDKYIRKAVLHQQDVDDFIQPHLDFQMKGVSSIYKVTQAYTTRGELGPGTLKFFRCQVDLKAEDPPSRSFKWDNEDHLRFLAQGARATAYAVWFLAHRVTERIGFKDDRNLTPYTRFVLGFSDADPAMSFLEDPHYVKLEDVNLLETHQANLDEQEKLDKVNKQVWKKCRPGYNEPFTPKPKQLPCCRMCGQHETKMEDRDLSKHHCDVKIKCKYPYCTTPNLCHSVITCDALRGWCLHCRRRGHVKEDHAKPGFNRVYAGFVFRKYAHLGHETGFVIYKPELAQNPRHTRMTFYGLPSTLVPKVSPEADLVSTDPNWKPPLPPPRRSSPPPRSASVRNREKPLRKKSFTPKMSLHRTKDGRIEKRTLIGSGSRPSIKCSLPLLPKTDIVKRQYDLQTLQADLMTAQRISHDGTAGSIGLDMTDSVRMILNVLEGERAFERSLIQAEQTSTSETRRQAPDMLVNFSDESSEASGNGSSVSDDEDESGVLNERNDNNISSSSSSDEEDLTSRRNRPRGSSASSHFWSEEEEYLKKTTGVDPAPEVKNPDNSDDKMDEDEVLEMQTTNSDMDLDAKKNDDAAN